MKVTAILQARMSSSRLPRKVLLPVLGKPMLARQIERTLLVKKIDTLIVATSDESSDDSIEELCNSLDVACYRGSLEDVLDRFYQAAKKHPADHIVRMTGDCPVIDPDVVDEVIQLHIDSNSDYTSNVSPPSFPDGLDVEVMRFETLEHAWENAKKPSEREHVTPFIREHKNLKQANFKNDYDLSDYRWTVDEKEDYDLICVFYESLYVDNPKFNYHDILNYLEKNPDIIVPNTHFERNQGYKKSLEEDF